MSNLPPLKVFFRALEPEDYKVSIVWRQDPNLWRMLIGRRYFVSEMTEKKWLENVNSTANRLALAICDVNTQCYIGNAYLTDIDYVNRSASSAKLIGNKEYWNSGFGTDTTLLLLHHAFFDLGLERIESRILPDNKASIRVLEKCGYQKEGVLRSATFKNGQLQDLVIMSVIKKDYLQLLERLT